MGVIDPIGQDINRGNYTLVEMYGQVTSSDRRSFENLRVEQYFKLKDMAFQGKLDLDPHDTELHDELRGVLYEYMVRGARKIESKDSMKKRNHKSPDRADAVWYACYDVDEMIDGPLAGVKKGDKVFFDPWSMLNTTRYSPGMPM